MRQTPLPHGYTRTVSCASFRDGAANDRDIPLRGRRFG